MRLTVYNLEEKVYFMNILARACTYITYVSNMRRPAKSQTRTEIDLLSASTKREAIILYF